MISTASPLPTLLVIPTGIGCAVGGYAGDALPVTRLRWSGGRDGCEVELVRIEGGGHTWPGQKPPVGFIGRSTESVSANALLWAFFSRHRLP